MSDKIQTLTCIGPPEHTWTRPSQRGKPPRWCAEHKPAPEAPRESATKPNGGSDNSTPVGVSEHGPTQVNPFILKAEREAQRKKMAELREKKSEKSEQRAIEEVEREQESMLEEYGTIDERIAAATEAYNKAREEAIHTQEVDKIDRAFDKADQKQNGLLQLLHRKRLLEQRLNDVTDATVVTDESKESMSMDDAMTLIQDAAENDPFESGGEFEEAHAANLAVLEGEAE